MATCEQRETKSSRTRVIGREMPTPLHAHRETQQRCEWVRSIRAMRCLACHSVWDSKQVVVAHQVHKGEAGALNTKEARPGLDHDEGMPAPLPPPARPPNVGTLMLQSTTKIGPPDGARHGTTAAPPHVAQAHTVPQCAARRERLDVGPRERHPGGAIARSGRSAPVGRLLGLVCAPSSLWWWPLFSRFGPEPLGSSAVGLSVILLHVWPF